MAIAPRKALQDTGDTSFQSTLHLGITGGSNQRSLDWEASVLPQDHGSATISVISDHSDYLEDSLQHNESISEKNENCPTSPGGQVLRPIGTIFELMKMRPHPGSHAFQQTRIIFKLNSRI
ncbi:hypothetical protein DPMN_126702 [Dreissena polymorpha]|uniref:Uncharacterized protein n=1 Tax=Dreissena polymorpha TaxID=45954 RepID=A0A9D4GZV6_DREPO|nr:hypothetical protein DPMN_126702 [Dreissena polymorpha]